MSNIDDDDSSDTYILSLLTAINTGKIDQEKHLAIQGLLANLVASSDVCVMPGTSLDEPKWIFVTEKAKDCLKSVGIPVGETLPDSTKNRFKDHIFDGHPYHVSWGEFSEYDDDNCPIYASGLAHEVGGYHALKKVLATANALPAREKNDKKVLPLH
jgi:hypothetical protein